MGQETSSRQHVVGIRDKLLAEKLQQEDPGEARSQATSHRTHNHLRNSACTSSSATQKMTPAAACIKDFHAAHGDFRLPSRTQ